MEIKQDDLSTPQTLELLELHLQGMHSNSPAGQAFAFDLSGLKHPNVTVWTSWKDGKIAGLGALHEFGDGTGEIKSMRTHPDFLRRGVAAELLEHIIGVARQRSLKRVSLETGSGNYFEPAVALYRSYGFQSGPPFAGYATNDFNQFMHLELDSQTAWR